MCKEIQKPGIEPSVLLDSGVVKEIGSPVLPKDVDSYVKVRQTEDHSFQLRTLLRAWEKQQEQDRGMRKEFARWLLIAASLQMVVVNLLFVLIGTGLLAVEEWTANSFVVGILAQVFGLVLVVVKYLFPPTEKLTDDLAAKLQDWKRK